MRREHSASHQSIKLVADTINKPVRSAFVHDLNAMSKDGDTMIHWNVSTIPLAESRLTYTLAQEANNHRMINRQGINRKGRSRRGEASRSICCWGLLVDKTVGPQHKGRAVDCASPPRGTHAAGHRADDAEDLSAMEDGFLNIGDTSLVGPDQLLVGTVETFTTGQTLNLRKVSYSIEADKMEDDEIGLHDSTDRVDLEVAVGHIVPALKQ